MRLFSIALTAFVAIMLPWFTVAEHLGPSRRHNALAARKRDAFDIQKYSKRQSFLFARLTYYTVGLGACGIYNKPSDFIVALNTPQYGGGYPGPNCFKGITIDCGGKQAHATITDECPGCRYGNLDLSEGLFGYFGDLSLGVLSCTWWFDGGESHPAPAPAPPSKPSSSKIWIPSPTLWTPLPTTPWTSALAIASHSSTIHNSTTAVHTTSTYAKPTPSIIIGGTPQAPENLQALGLLVAQIGNMISQIS